MSIVPSDLTCGVIQNSPVGPLTLRFSSHVLVQIEFGDRVEREDADAPFHEAAHQLDAYFSGDLNNFSIPYGLSGTPFQKRVWSLLIAIPYGETRTYGQLAGALGNVNLARAVGTATGANPVPIICPCHRVIGTDGRLTGYSGGLLNKQILLQLESRWTRPDLFMTNKDRLDDSV